VLIFNLGWLVNQQLKIAKNVIPSLNIYTQLDPIGKSVCSCERMLRKWRVILGPHTHTHITDWTVNIPSLLRVMDVQRTCVTGGRKQAECTYIYFFSFKKGRESRWKTRKSFDRFCTRLLFLLCLVEVFSTFKCEMGFKNNFFNRSSKFFIESGAPDVKE